MSRLTASLLTMSFVLIFTAGATAQDKAVEVSAKEIRAIRDKGLDWLTKNQAKDGSWGKQYTIAVSSFACLSYLAASDEPFAGDHAKALVKGLEFLLASQNEGTFSPQGHSWI